MEEEEHEVYGGEIPVADEAEEVEMSGVGEEEDAVKVQYSVDYWL